MNTDAQALEQSLAQNRVQIGSDATRGLGTGGNPSLGEHAAQESLESLQTCVNNGDMVSRCLADPGCCACMTVV